MDRKARLAAALRANLAKRKAHLRQADAADRRPEAPDASDRERSADDAAEASADIWARRSGGDAGGDD